MKEALLIIYIFHKKALIDEQLAENFQIPSFPNSLKQPLHLLKIYVQFRYSL